jgi:hypothetical protein
MRRPMVALVSAWTLLLADQALAAVPESPRLAAQELEEVLVDGRRPLRNTRAVLDWLARLVGQFSVDGRVDLHGRSEAGLLHVQGRSNCIALGSAPAVLCELNIRWPEVRGSDGESITGAISNLDPAILMFGFEFIHVGIHHMLVGNDGIADGALGYLLSEDTLVARAKCAGVVGACERVVRITAEPDAKAVRVEIEIQIDLRAAVTISFAMHRLPGSPSLVYPGAR